MKNERTSLDPPLKISEIRDLGELSRSTVRDAVDCSDTVLLNGILASSAGIAGATIASVPAEVTIATVDTAWSPPIELDANDLLGIGLGVVAIGAVIGGLVRYRRIKRNARDRAVNVFERLSTPGLPRADIGMTQLVKNITSSFSGRYLDEVEIAAQSFLHGTDLSIESK